jgi:hypothetical protein
MLKTFEPGSRHHAASELRRAARLVAEHGPGNPTTDRVLADLHLLQKAALAHVAMSGEDRDTNVDAIRAGG